RIGPWTVQGRREGRREGGRAQVALPATLIRRGVLVRPGPGGAVPAAAGDVGDALPAGSLQGGAGLLSEDVGHDPRKTHLLGDPSGRAVEHGGGVLGARGAAPGDLTCQAVVESARDRAADDRDPDDLALVLHRKAELMPPGRE